MEAMVIATEEDGWIAFMNLAIAVAIIGTIVIGVLNEHPEKFGYQKIPVEQTIEETINDTSDN